MDSTYKQERVVAWYVQVEYFLCFFRVGLLSRPEKKKNRTQLYTCTSS